MFIHSSLKTTSLENKETSVTDTHQWYGQQYAKNSTPQAKRNLAALKEFGLYPDDTVLDVGCGSGETTCIMASLAKTVQGIDSSDSMVTKAKENGKDIKNLSIEKADARGFKFSERFSVITSFFCLQWIPKNDIYKTYKNINDHLKNDGRICILLPCYDFPHDIIKGLAKTEKWRDRFDGFQDAQLFESVPFYEFLLKNIGVIDLQISVIQSEHPMTDDEFIQYTRQWCGCYKWLEKEDERSDFIRDIKERLKQEKHDSDSSQFTMTHQSLRIFGKKQNAQLDNKPVEGGTLKSSFSYSA